ncbi:MAG TPA: GNAT family N-acetyltransferase, partial [Nocardioides sp.]
MTVIRPATTDDVPGLVALEGLLFGADAWSEAQVREELTGPGREVLVAADEGPIGYVATLVVDEVADLQRIGVHPERQRQGLAAALLDAALASQRPA